MLVWFYRKSAIDKAREAVAECPALRLDECHPSLVMFQREHQNDQHPSVIRFENYAALEKMCVELNKISSYTAGAVDTFGDTWTGDELREMLKRSEYSLNEPNGGTSFWPIRGNFKSNPPELIAEAVLDREEKEEQAERENNLAKSLAKDLGFQRETDGPLALRLVKQGFTSGHLFSGVVAADLISTTQFNDEEAAYIIEKAKAANLL
jgi:hypothetical protein